MDALGKIHAVIGDTAVTNVLLGWGAFELRRLVPLGRGIVRHFRIQLARPQTEPPHAAE
jgi:hypothetical protein